MPGAAVVVVATAGTREGFCPGTCAEIAFFCALAGVTFCVSADGTTKIVSVKTTDAIAAIEANFIALPGGALKLAR